MPEKQIKILLVEDDPFLLNMYATKFEENNFKVIIANDGEEALNLIKADYPDIILLDILLPRMNGFEVLKRIKTEKTTSLIPVILLTNLSQKNEVEQGLALGANDYLIKARNTPTEVVEKIKKLLKLE